MSITEIRPDEPGYASYCRLVVDALSRADENNCVFVALVAKSTRMELAIVLQSAMFQVTEPRQPAANAYAMVAVMEHGAYWFDLESYLAPSYVAEKLNITSADGETIAEFLTRLGAAMRMEGLRHA